LKPPGRAFFFTREVDRSIMANPNSIRAGRAFVELAADDSKLQAGLKSAQARLRSFGRAIASAFPAAALSGITAGVAAIRRFDESLDFAGKIGIVAGRLQELEHAAVRTGSSSESLRSSLAKMLRTVGEAGSGNKAAATALEAIGLSAEKLRRMSPEQIFAAISDGIRQIPDAAGQMQAAMDIFGRGGGDIVQTLQLGSAGLAEMATEARGLGKVMSAETVASINEANDAFDKLSAAADGALAKLATWTAKLLPVLELVGGAAEQWERHFGGGSQAPAPPAPPDPAGMQKRMLEINKEVQSLMQRRQLILDDTQMERVNQRGVSAAASALTHAWGSMEAARVDSQIAALSKEASAIAAAWKTIPEHIRNTAMEAEAVKPIYESLNEVIRDQGALLGGVAQTVGQAIARAGKSLGGLGSMLGVGAVDTGAIEAWKETARAESEAMRMNQDRADALRESVMTPQERVDRDFFEAASLFEQGLIDEQTFDRFNKQLSDMIAGFDQVSSATQQFPEFLAAGTQEAAEAVLKHTFGGPGREDESVRLERNQLAELRGVRRAIDDGNRADRNVLRVEVASVI
jgi:hypothetical protein